MKSFIKIFALALLGALLVSSCKKTDNPVTSNTTAHASGTYVGMIAGGTESGTLSLTVPSSSSFSKSLSELTIITVTGTLNIGGSPIALTGTYNTANDSLYVTGGGYTFMGTYSHGTLVGSYTGPNGPGGFSTESSSGSDSVKVYLGTATSQVSGHGGATLNIVVKGSALIGMAVGTDNSKTPFAGTISGDNIHITVTYSGISADLATGTFNAGHTSASGTYDTTPFSPHDADHGTWSVTIAQ
ncbi:MAG TPA: hypothetical protein VKS81_06865 [Bacteroidota bacterium]|nr:hypothetical protein [Bacteroidota bacterium]